MSQGGHWSAMGAMSSSPSLPHGASYLPKAQTDDFAPIIKAMKVEENAQRRQGRYPSQKSENEVSAGAASPTTSVASSTTRERGKKRYPCEEPNCGKSFDSRWALVRHIRVHTGEKPFPCTYPNCGKSFAEKSAMTRHLQTHSRVKPYKCTYEGCSKSFKGKDYLEFHLKIHEEGNPYACEFPNCSKTFCSPKSLKKHMRQGHGQDVDVLPPTQDPKPPSEAPENTSVEQFLRDRIIRMATRDKERSQRYEATIQELREENERLQRRLLELEPPL